ncbi:hypothetical protein M378DRAFT_82004 [Amanita muscaria Koide BX008]|uniref:DUF3752 domain-containing protein n=1 Tax=Amanita muscaria (strain Koide BX008) TaxID=946122 RepID=A0A0C2SFK5_AMAMK|nr:hypothetical protein M378DRAFT_82004 [Amanita muscaria Koide BX008]
MIGPALPPHLVAQGDGEEQDVSIGPQIPVHLLAQKSTTPPLEEDDEDGSVPLPEPRKQAQTSGPSSSVARRPIGPVLPSYALNDEDEDEDEVGPRPPSYYGVQHDVDDGVRQFMEVEEKRRKQIEEASKPKPLKRDEWMLKPPTSSELLANLDPTKLKAPRQFSRTKGASSSGGGDSSLWTETPAEKQQRLADEVVGKRRRAADPVPEDDDKKKRKKDEEYIRKGVNDYTVRLRGPSLIQQHTVAFEKNKQDKDEPEGIWDHARDMGVGGLLMDDEKRSKFIKEARGLGDRFSSGKSGGFL